MRIEEGYGFLITRYHCFLGPCRYYPVEDSTGTVNINAAVWCFLLDFSLVFSILCIKGSQPTPTSFQVGFVQEKESHPPSQLVLDLFFSLTLLILSECFGGIW